MLPMLCCCAAPVLGGAWRIETLQRNIAATEWMLCLHAGVGRSVRGNRGGLGPPAAGRRACSGKGSPHGGLRQRGTLGRRALAARAAGGRRQDRRCGGQGGCRAAPKCGTQGHAGQVSGAVPGSSLHRKVGAPARRIYPLSPYRFRKCLRTPAGCRRTRPGGRGAQTLQRCWTLRGCALQCMTRLRHHELH